MKAIEEMSLGELAAYIDSNLRENGVDVVLSGGACVAIYSDHIYVSKDLDFIAQFTIDRVKVDSIMRKLGFDPRGRYYSHPQTSYFVEFISGPPSVGQDPIEEIVEMEMETGKVRIISPTDCVKDRLAAYFHWGDQQGLEQAVLVSKLRSIDMDIIKKWSIRERKMDEFKTFLQRLQ